MSSPPPTRPADASSGTSTTARSNGWSTPSSHSSSPSDAIAAGHGAAELVDEALRNAERANSELRDIVRGILPAALIRGGLRAGLASLTGDLALPVDVRVDAPRLPVHIETTAYFIVAEALTNVTKHAQATRATVEVDLRAGVAR